jgi:hypothetical protein
MKEIKLSQRGKNKGKYVALVDDDDFDCLNQFKWSVYKSSNSFYTIRAIRIDGRRITQSMHCAIMNGKGIDHIDHNGLNNQKSNLRFCTQGQNMMNTRKRENCSSIYKGVSFYKSYGRWKANTAINGKDIFLGYFDTEIEAAMAYNKKAIEIYGEFANLNKFDSKK